MCQRPLRVCAKVPYNKLGHTCREHRKHGPVAEWYHSPVLRELLALTVNEDMACRTRQRHTFSRMGPRRLGTSYIAHCTSMFSMLVLDAAFASPGGMRHALRFARRHATYRG